MKKLILLFCFAFIAKVAFLQPFIVPGSPTQEVTDICADDYVTIVSGILIVDPAIQTNFTGLNFSILGAFTQTNTTFSVTGDSLWVDVLYTGAGLSPGPIALSISASVNPFPTTTDTINFNFNINANPVITNTSTSIGSFCSSDSPFDITGYFSPAGGTFSYGESSSAEALSILSPNGIFDPSSLPSSLVGEDIYYNYTDPTNGCSASDTWSWYGQVLPIPEFTTTPTDATTCSSNDGLILVSATAPTGTTNFTSYIPTGDTINVPLIAPNNFTGLKPGQYYVSVVDDDGCVATDVVSIAASDLNISANVLNTSCPGTNDGSIDITVNTSNSYTHYWSHGTFVEDLTNMPAGKYTINVTDDNGCETSKTFTIGSPLLEFDPLYTYGGFYDCANTTPVQVDAAVIADNQPVTYSFPAGGSMVNDSSYTYTTPDNYVITVTDASGCSIDTTLITPVYTDFDIYVQTITPSECGGATGSVLVSITEWTPGMIDYMQWSNGATTEDLINVPAGTYTLDIININDPTNCSLHTTVEVPNTGPAKNEICLISVDTNTTTNLVVWEREETTGIDRYNIYRENENGVSEYIDFVDNSEETIFNDVWASPLVKSWSYRIAAVNTCGVEGPKSFPHKTIHLRKEAINATDMKLNWNLYEGFNYAQQDIYRFTTTTNEWQYLTSVPSTQTSFIDTPPSLTGVDYGIGVELGFTCTSTKATSHNASRSNRSNGVFNPGEGTGHSNNDIDVNETFTAKLFPNPAQSSTMLQFDLAQNYTVVITNISGQVIEEVNFTGNQVEINTDNLSNGIYLIAAFTNNNKVVKKLVVNH